VAAHFVAVSINRPETEHVQEHILEFGHRLQWKEDTMPYPPEHRDRTRARIIRSAQVLFNRHGFTTVSIDQVMAHAGLTRGGFYSYFETKSELYAEAVTLALAETPWSRWDGVSVDFAAHDAARQVVRAYLSHQHFDDVDGSCPMVTLPGDVARSDKPVKKAFENVFSAMAGLFEEALERDGRGDPKRALAIAGICVGGMVVARSMDSSALADAIRNAAMQTALELGGWRSEKRSDARRAQPRGAAARTAGPPARRRAPP
jgi:AcrR family transcriptional regulator